MSAKIYYENDAPIDGLKGKKVAVIGYGSQGHAHSLNLRDSGIEVATAELEGTDNYKLAQKHGFSPTDIVEAVHVADLDPKSIDLLTPYLAEMEELVRTKKVHVHKEKNDINTNWHENKLNKKKVYIAVV